MQFSSDSSGLVDVFAQVFAQMSLSIALPSSPPTSPPVLAPESSRETATDEQLDSGATDDASSTSRDAALLAITASEQPRVQNNVERPSEPRITSEQSLASAVDKPANSDRSQPPSNDAVADLAQPAETATAAAIASSGSADTRAPALSSSTQRDSDDATDVTVAAAKSTRTTTPEVSGATEKPAVKLEEEPADASVDVARAAAADEPSNDDSDTGRPGRRGNRHRGSVDAGETPAAALKVSDANLEPARSEAPADAAASAPVTASVATEVAVATTPNSAASAASAGTTAVAAAGQVASRSAATTSAAGPSSSGSTSGNFNASLPPVANAAQRGDAASKSNSSQSNSASDAVTRAKLVQRVSKAFQHLGVDGGTIRLRLAPAELGSVRVEMQIQGRKVNARVVAETEAASQLLRDQLPELRSRLEAQGMQVESIEVETDEKLFSNSRDSSHQHSRDDEQRYGADGAWDAEPANLKRPVSRAIVPLATTPPSAMITSAGVDIRI